MPPALPNQSQVVARSTNDAYTSCMANAYHALKNRFSQLLQKNDSLTKNQRSLRRQLDQAQRENTKIRNERQRLQVNYDKLAKDMGRLSMEKSQIYAQLEHERFQRELGDLVLDQYKDEIIERNEEIEREVFKKELSDLLLEQYRGEIEEQKKALSEKELRIASCHRQMLTFGSEVSYWRQRVNLGENQICKLASELEHSKGEMHRKNTMIARLEKERREAVEGCSSFQAEIRKLKATYDELEMRVDALGATEFTEADEPKKRLCISSVFLVNRESKMKPPRPPTPGLALPHRREINSSDSQTQIMDFWSRLHSQTPRLITSIFPTNLHFLLLADNACYPKPFITSQSYDMAAQQCQSRVESIVNQCIINNTKFRDTDFDIESDFATSQNNYLFDLTRCIDQTSRRGKDPFVKGSPRSSRRYSSHSNKEDDTSLPGSVHRIPWIFENPQFTQGNSGDCWWLAALGTIAHREDLMNKICVARNEEVGVYGFVFYRDGAWISTVVDDNLYLKEPDFDKGIYDATGSKARYHRKQKQCNSEALFFAKCIDPNETWLPLLEKAFAKVHGDYQALDGGWAGIAMEDLTGGIATLIATNSILDKERLWRELLSCGTIDGEFLFTLSSGPGFQHRNGIVLSHTYSILEAIELKKEHGGMTRLVKIRNPWGQRSDTGYGEWCGAWADGSREWNTHTINALHHEFGDNGIFWMTYDDAMENFDYLYRTRLPHHGWTMAQKWMSTLVPWLPGFLKKKFIIDLKDKSTVIIVLSQLDDRYFPGLQGEYDFTLHFLLRPLISKIDICQVSPCHLGDGRSINCELVLEAGTYEVIPKVIAERNGLGPVEETVKLAASRNPQKLRQVGLQYDLEHAKDGVIDPSQQLEQPQPSDLRGKSVNLRSNFSQDKNLEYWSPVCVIGLRVYAKHPNFVINII
ncbi:hypothetical protein DER44DRAFT_727641 [Fusarium oxysporum]|nr:hypothetical protein DER44DRAFT_727641 [Fusarium oxysporum]